MTVNSNRGCVLLIEGHSLLLLLFANTIHFNEVCQQLQVMSKENNGIELGVCVL